MHYKSICSYIPPYPFIFCIFLFLLPNTISKTQAQETESSPSTFSRIWEIGCEFSGVVSRVRRSAPTPEPDFENPEELFDYLYPLADVKPEDQEDNVGGARSHGSHSISSWLEDLMELWHNECHYMRNKRSAKRMTTYPRKGSSKGRHSSGTSGKSSRRQDDSDDTADYDDDDKTRMNMFNKPNKNVTTTTTAAPTTTAPIDPSTLFFTQYGGDIEYFFPLLSFGIPFDGEITLLGFHGFRGIFPY